MVLFNHSTRELTAKIVYYGPGLCGKTTNLRLLHEKLDQATTGRLLSLSTAQDRTIYFDLLPVELGNVKGYTVRFQLCTVPGQVFYNETRKLVLKGADGIVFVVDSQWSMLSHNLESFQNLRENLAELGQNLDEAAVVIQYNKRDLPGVLSVQALQESLGFQEFPFVESIAADAKGVVETFKLVSKLTFIHILKRLQRSPDGERLGPDWVAPSPANSQSALRIPAASAQLLALTSTVGPAPAPPTESPFETTGSWPGLEKGEVFGETTIPPFPIDLPAEPEPEPEPEPLPEMVLGALPEPEPEQETGSEPVPEPPAPPAALEPPPPPPAPQPPPPPPATAVWAEAFAGISSRLDEMARVHAEGSARVEALARETREAVEAMPVTVKEALEGRVDELRTSLEQRLSALEATIAKLEASDRLEEVRRETLEVKRLVESKLDEASGQSRRLSGFLRRALEELDPPDKG